MELPVILYLKNETIFNDCFIYCGKYLEPFYKQNYSFNNPITYFLIFIIIMEVIIFFLYYKLTRPKRT